MIQDFILGEIRLTASVSFGVFMGWVLIRYGIADKFLIGMGPRIRKWGFHPDIVAAFALSLGASRAATGFIAASGERGTLTEREVVFGTLILSFPAYLRRWLATLGASIGLAGMAGGIYSISLIVRSALRFFFFVWMILRERRTISSKDIVDVAENPVGAVPSVWGMLSRTLPWGWGCYGLVFWGMPFLEPVLREAGESVIVLSPTAWSVAVAGMAHNTAALAAAGAALSGGILSVPEAVLALLIGNFFGTLSRLVRQNLSFWSGVFPGKTLALLLLWHLGTLLPLMLLWILLSYWFCGVVQ